MRIFKQLKNHEDSSDFDDFWTESIASTQTINPEIFGHPRRQKPPQINSPGQRPRACLSRLPPPPSTQSQASGLRALALGGIWEVHVRLFLLWFFGQKTIFILIAKISKKRRFWEAKMASKIEFFEFWRVLVSDLNFRSIFYRFFIDFSKLESLKIVLPPRRNAYFCKIHAFASNQKTIKKTSILESKIH